MVKFDDNCADAICFYIIVACLICVVLFVLTSEDIVDEDVKMRFYNVTAELIEPTEELEINFYDISAMLNDSSHIIGIDCDFVRDNENEPPWEHESETMKNLSDEINILCKYSFPELWGKVE